MRRSTNDKSQRQAYLIKCWISKQERRVVIVSPNSTHQLIIAFSDAELRDLFTLSIKTDGCQTRKSFHKRPADGQMIYLGAIVKGLVRAL